MKRVVGGREFAVPSPKRRNCDSECTAADASDGEDKAKAHAWINWMMLDALEHRRRAEHVEEAAGGGCANESVGARGGEARAAKRGSRAKQF